jgi:hypothetical protein
VISSQKRGLASGVMGVLLIEDNLAGVIVSGLFVDATKPFQRTSITSGSFYEIRVRKPLFNY